MADPERLVNSPWSLPLDQLAQDLRTDLDSGLNEGEADRRLAQWGPNHLPEPPRPALALLFLRQFADVMIGLLAAAAVISGLLGDWTDTLLIGLIVIGNAGVGFAQEWKADRAIEALKRLSGPLARVRRQGDLHRRSVASLVPGDVIELRAGDSVPADARIISSTALEANESPLTGESLPVEKEPGELPADAPLPDRSCMVYSGTTIAHGHGRALVVATGGATELGLVATLLESAPNTVTPLQRRLAAMNRRITLAVVLICLLIFAAGILREPASAWSQSLVAGMLLTAVSLAVAAIPEGLPAVITVTLALGSQRMARRQAVIRRLAAVEALGSVDVICTDKTGTLTQNRMAVSDLLPIAPDEHARRRLLQACVLCNNAELLADGQILGSATESALIAAALQSGMDVMRIRKDFPRVGEVPFSSQRKRMTTRHADGAGRQLIYMKGAAERVLPLCQWPQEPDLESWKQRADDLAQTGRRVLAVAMRLDEGALPPSAEDDGRLELLGLAGLVDPIRPEARSAVAACRSAGIQTVMITGDHPGTALAVASELGLSAPPEALLTGAELDHLSDRDLEERAAHARVYARVSPEHKLRIVRALQSRGRLTAMTGDGVNDAPALRQADVGVAMGQTGTDVAKEAAGIVLVDDNFATIVAAVEEGRIVDDNIRKFVTYLLTANFSEVLVVLGALLGGLPAPLLPAHLLWINLATDGLPALALGFEPAEPDVMRRPPRPREDALLSPRNALAILALGSLMAACCLGLFASELVRTGDLSRARSLAFLAICLSQLLYVLGIRSFSAPLRRTRLAGNPRLIVAVALGAGLQFCVLFIPVLARWFHVVPLTPADLGLAFFGSAIPLLALEVSKWARGRTPRRNNL